MFRAPRPLHVNLENKTCIVTGATSGIGQEIARNFARMGARVVLACRDEGRGYAALEDIRASTRSDRLELLLVDFSSLLSIRAFCAETIRRHPRIDVLVNNAGVWPRVKQKSADGYELTFATNVLGYFLTSKLLEEHLKRNAPARIVNVASTFAGGLDLDDPMFERRRFVPALAYAQSKQANRMLTWAQAERLAGSGVTVNAVHPGPVNTRLNRDMNGVVGNAIKGLFEIVGRTPEQGAETPTWVAAAEELVGVTGGFWVGRKQKRCRFRDPDAARALWGKCDSLIL